MPVCGAGYQSGSTGGVWAETPDTVFVLQRGCLPAIPTPTSIVPSRNASQYSLAAEDPARHPRWDHILVVYNREGKQVESWEQHNKLFVRPHRVVMNPYDPEHHVWVIDDGAHSVYKFTRDGKQLVMTLGEFRVPGNDQTHFGRPTDIAWLPNGDFFVSDGYGNSRVVKFNKDGEYLLEWGKPGHASPGEFDTVHGIAVDDQRRVYVDDRANHRIQIFDENGNYLDQWTNLRYPYSIFMSRDQHLWVSDGGGHFVDRGVESGAAFNQHGQAEAGMGVQAEDVDGDGHLDLLVTHLRRDLRGRHEQGRCRRSALERLGRLRRHRR